jgi:hypothetical protein
MWALLEHYQWGIAKIKKERHQWGIAKIKKERRGIASLLSAWLDIFGE